MSAPPEESLAATLREMVELTGVCGYTSWWDEERALEVVRLETHKALVEKYMALGRAAGDLLNELEQGDDDAVAR